MFSKSIDFGKCTGCMQCQGICTNSQVIVRNDEGKPEFRYESKCIFCGHCLAICPEGAITFTPLQDLNAKDGFYFAETAEQNQSLPPLSAESVFDFLGSTRSNRIFKDQPVEHEKLETIVDAMVRAASAGNEQNRNYYVLSNPETLDQLEKALAAHFEKKLRSFRSPVSQTVFAYFGALRAGKQNMGTIETTQMPFRKRYRLMRSVLKEALPEPGSPFSYLKQAPVAILITEGKKDNSMHKAFYRGDACIAATYGVLMAKALGLASCWMGLLEIALSQNAGLGQWIGLKPGERTLAALVVGYSDIVWHRLPPRGPVEITWLP